MESITTLIPAAEIKDVVINLKNGKEVKFPGIRSCEIETRVGKEEDPFGKITYVNSFHIDITGSME